RHASSTTNRDEPARGPQPPGTESREENGRNRQQSVLQQTPWPIDGDQQCHYRREQEPMGNAKSFHGSYCHTAVVRRRVAKPTGLRLAATEKLPVVRPRGQSSG